MPDVLPSASSRSSAEKDACIAITVHLIYLLLTFGRGKQTIGEEYTDVIPASLAKHGVLSRKVGRSPEGLRAEQTRIRGKQP